MRAVAATGTGQIGAGHAAGVAEAVAGVAGGGGEHLAAVFEAAVLHAGLRGGAELFERPHRRRASHEHGADVFDRGLLLGLFGDQFGELGLLGLGEGGEAVVADEFDEFVKAGAALVVGGCEEPFELLFAEFGGPSGLQESQAAGVLQLRFLALCGGDERHAFGGGVRCLQVGKRFGEQPVELKIVRRIGWIELGNDRGDGGVVRIAKAMQHDLDEAHIGHALIVREFAEVVLEQRGEDLIALARVHLRAFGAMRGALARETCHGEQGFELRGGVRFGECLRFPLGERLMLEHDASGGSDVAVFAAEVRPGRFDGFGVLFAVEGFEGVAELSARFLFPD